MTTMDKNGNITHVKGDNFYLNFTSVQVNGVNIDWTGYTASMKIKDSINDTTGVITLTQADGIDISTNGQFTIDKAITFSKKRILLRLDFYGRGKTEYMV